MIVRRRLVFALVVVAIVVLLVSVVGGSSTGVSGPGSGGAGDALGYTTAREATLIADAAAGLSHILYAKSPGGVLATAQRTVKFESDARTAAKSGPLDAPTLEGIVALESAGRPNVIAGPDPSYAAGLTQIVAETATGFLGMRVDLAKSTTLTDQIEVATTVARERALETARAKIDQRFNPRDALAGTERYLKVAMGVFGRIDLAVESYHMGIGNLERALRLYAGSADSGASVAKLVADQQLSYAKLYFSSTPINHAAAYKWLASLGDDSSTYLWRVYAARQIVERYTSDREALRRQAALEALGHSSARVLRPPASTPLFANRTALARARSNATLVAVNDAPGLTVAAPLHLRPLARAMLLYIAAGTRAIAHGSTTLELTSATIDIADLRTAVAAGQGYITGDPLAASGYAFDISRSYASTAQGTAFQFILDRLSTLDMISWERYPRVIHIVVGPAAKLLVSQPA